MVGVVDQAAQFGDAGGGFGGHFGILGHCVCAAPEGRQRPCGSGFSRELLPATHAPEKLAAEAAPKRALEAVSHKRSKGIAALRTKTSATIAVAQGLRAVGLRCAPLPAWVRLARPPS